MKLFIYMRNHRHEFTHKEFAEGLGITKTHFSKIVNGWAKPSIELAKLIEIKTNGEVKWYEFVDEVLEMRDTRAKRKSLSQK